MAGFVSEVDLESDTSSMDDVKESLSPDEQNRILKAEIESLKVQVKRLNEANEQLRRNSVNIQVKAEQEEEYISNTLLKKITELKKEKESLAINYEQEEECLTNELNKKFTQLRQEKVALQRTLAKEQEDQVCKLKSRIEKLETDMHNKQDCLDRLRREKVELENALEQEQEALVNRLWKKMEKLETEKRTLQEKLESLGAALLSGSSSNQSLASIGQHGVASDTSMGGGGAMATTTTASVGLLLDPCPSSMTSASSRPGSSGPGSLRTSGRPAHVGQVRTSLATGSALLLAPGMNTSTPAPSLPVGVLTAGSADTKLQQQQHNQSSAAAVTNIPCSLTEQSGHPPSGQQRPPQSPMDTDALMLERTFHSIGGTVSAHSPTQHHVVDDSRERQQASTRSPSQHQESNGPSVSLSYVNRLRDEVIHLRKLLTRHEAESATRMSVFESEERSVAEENRKLRQQLAAEKERREALSRQLSESESSLEMEDERHFNEACRSARLRTISDSSTPPFHLPTPPNVSAPHTVTPAFYGPGHAYAAAVAAALAGSSHVTAASRHCCRECGQRLPALEDHHSYPHSHTPQQFSVSHSHAHSHQHRPLSTCFAAQHLSHPPGMCVRTGVVGCTCATCAHSPPSSTVGSGRPAALTNSPSTPTTTGAAAATAANHDNGAAGSVQAFAKPSGHVGSSAPHQPMKVDYPPTPQKRLSSTLFTASGGRHPFSEGLGGAPGNWQCRPGYPGDEVAFPADRNGEACDDQDDDEEERRCATPPLCQTDSAKQ